MSRLFESHDFLNRGWDVRVLEAQSLRSLFLWLLLATFLLGMMASMVLYQAVQLHRFQWSDIFLLLVFGLAIFRCAPVIYRRLER